MISAHIQPGKHRDPPESEQNFLRSCKLCNLGPILRIFGHLLEDTTKQKQVGIIKISGNHIQDPDFSLEDLQMNIFFFFGMSYLEVSNVSQEKLLLASGLSSNG